MQTLRSTAIALVFVTASGPLSGSGAAAQDLPCDALELRATPGAPPAYQSALCKGVEHQRNLEMEEALVEFQRALAVPFHEAPNFLLLPRMAALAGRLENSEYARELEAEAEVAFGIYFGLFACSPEAPDAPPIGAETFAPGSASRAAARMCGAAREWAYQRSTMNEFIADLTILEIYRVNQAEWASR